MIGWPSLSLRERDDGAIAHLVAAFTKYQALPGG